MDPLLTKVFMDGAGRWFCYELWGDKSELGDGSLTCVVRYTERNCRVVERLVLRADFPCCAPRDPSLKEGDNFDRSFRPAKDMAVFDLPSFRQAF